MTMRSPRPARSGSVSRQGQAARAGPVLVRRRHSSADPRGAGGGPSGTARRRPAVCLRKGRILAGFLGEAPAVIPQSKNRDFQEATRQLKAPSRKSSAWVQAFQGGEPTVGNFLLAARFPRHSPRAVSLRLGANGWSGFGQHENHQYAGGQCVPDPRIPPGWEI